MFPFPVSPSELPAMVVRSSPTAVRGVDMPSVLAKATSDATSGHDVKDPERASSPSTADPTEWSSIGGLSEDLSPKTSESSLTAYDQEKPPGIVTLGEMPWWLWQEQPDDREQEEQGFREVVSAPPSVPMPREVSYSDSESAFLQSAEQYRTRNSSLIVLGAEEQERFAAEFNTSATEPFDSRGSRRGRSQGRLNRRSPSSVMSGLAQKTLRALTPPRCSDSETSENAVIIFDWDDTLMPTTFIKRNLWLNVIADEKWREASVDPSSPFYEMLAEHAQIVERMIRSAREVARVAIVTLATRAWVTISSQVFLPGVNLEALLTELDIEVYSADPNSKYCRLREALGQDVCKSAKRAAMHQCLKKLYANTNARWNVVSIGDSTAEKQAIKECLKYCAATATQQPLCKTVKLRPNMTVAELGQELERLRPTLQKLVALGRACDRTPRALGSMWQPAFSKLVRI